MESKLTERRRRKSRMMIRRKRRRKRRRVEIDEKRKKEKNSQANLAQNDLDVSDDEDFIFLAQNPTNPTLAQSL